MALEQMAAAMPGGINGIADVIQRRAAFEAVIGSSPVPIPTGSGGATPNTALAKALAAAQADLAARSAAYAKNDLVAAAEADARLQADIKAAILAGGNSLILPLHLYFRSARRGGVERASARLA